MNDSFGDRMKTFEREGTNARATPGLPLMVRLDGKTFSKFTRGLERPFDKRLSHLMLELTKYLVKTFDAKLGYVQSDEISLYFRESKSGEFMFSGKFSKINSILAASASVFFNKHLATMIPEKADESPLFDCRSWSIPENELANAFIWRQEDCTKNAVSMTASTYISHAKLQGKSTLNRIDMLRGIDIDFGHMPEQFKNGAFVYKIPKSLVVAEGDLLHIPEKFRPKIGEIYTRNIITSECRILFKNSWQEANSWVKSRI